MKLFGHTHSTVPVLFAGLFDDAGLFPPAALPMADAVARHGAHRHAWYSDAVGWFVCPTSRIGELDVAAQHARFSDTNVAVTVPGGVDAVDEAVDTVAEYGWLHLKSLELAVQPDDLPAAINRLAHVAKHAPSVFVELPVSAITADTAGMLKAAGFGLKIRTGGLSADMFPSTHTLATALAAACDSGVRFKLTAGLHRAVRHVDHETGFLHHGFANVLCAVDALQTGSGVQPAERWLVSGDESAIAHQLSSLAVERAESIRSQFAAIGTCSIDEPIADLERLNLLRRR